MKSGDDRELVYSSEQGWSQTKQGRDPARAGARPLPDDGVVRVSRERRRGGVVSLVTGLAQNECEPIAKLLRSHCGTGGTAKHGVVEIQGDHREKIVAWFAAQERKVKRAGG